MTGPRLVILDLDGTVIDSRPAMFAAFVAAHRAAGCLGAPPFVDFARMSGAALETIIGALGLPPEMVELFRRESRARMGDVSIVHGMDRFCEWLTESGARVVLLTGKERDRTEEMLQFLGIEDWWDLVLTSSDGFCTKTGS